MSVRNEGQVTKLADRRYKVRIFLGRDATGKRKYVNRTVHGTKKDADKVKRQMLRDRDLGVLVRASNQPLDEYLDTWLDTAVKPRVQPGTHKEYARTLKRYVRPHIGPVRLSKLSPVAIQGVYSKMQDAGVTKSVRYVHMILKNALSQAVRWQLLAQNPAEFVDVPKAPSTRKMRAMSQAEVDAFLRAADRSKWWPLFNVMVGTGLRPSEALALRWQDIDLGTGSLTVNQRVRWINGAWEFNQPKTASSRRNVPLPHGVVRVLSKHLDNQRELGLFDLAFCGIDGEPVHQRGIVSDAFKPSLRRAGLSSEIRFYDLRHTHATLLLQAGVHPKVVAERLGHASIKVTLDTYSHVMPGMQREAAEKLDVILFRDGSRATHPTARPN